MEKNPAAHINIIYSCIEKQMQVIWRNPTVCGYYLVLKNCPGFPDFVQDLGSERAAVRTRIDGKEKYRADVLRYASEFLYRSFRFDGQSGLDAPFSHLTNKIEMFDVRLEMEQDFLQSRVMKGGNVCRGVFYHQMYLK